MKENFLFLNITEGIVGYKKSASNIPLENGSVIVADPYYNDLFPMPNIWDSSGMFFVIRDKVNLVFIFIKERELPSNIRSKRKKSN